MTQDQWTQLVSILIGATGVVVWRLIDRFLPDPNGKHPLPAAPRRSREPGDVHDVDGDQERPGP